MRKVILKLWNKCFNSEKYLVYRFSYYYNVLTMKTASIHALIIGY